MLYRGLCAIAFVLAAGAQAEVVMLNPSKDATLYEDPQGLLASGSGEYLFAGETVAGLIRRAVLAFDLSGIPLDAQVNSATLSLHMSRTITSPLPMTLQRVTSAWGEGASVGFGEGGNGAPALPGDATWVHSVLGMSAWRTPGGDFASPVSATATVGADGFYQWTGLAPDVVAWLGDPGSNHGWILRGLEGVEGLVSAKRFDSRENPNPEFRPVLRVEYTPVPAPGTVVLVGVGAACMLRRRRGG